MTYDKTSGREKQLEDTILMYQEQLKEQRSSFESEKKALEALANPPGKVRTDLVDAIYNDMEMSWRPGQPGIYFPMKMRGSPDGYECGKVYKIPLAELNDSHPWWRRT